MPIPKVDQRIFQIHTANALHVWVRDFLLDLRAANRTDSTISFYREKLCRFLTFAMWLSICSNELIHSKLVLRTSGCVLVGNRIICSLSCVPSLPYNKLAIALQSNTRILGANKRVTYVLQ
jgi:hypothetical protein